MTLLQLSIEYLELFAVAAAVLTWVRRYQNQSIYLFCDNSSVVSMLNHSTSGCRNYMVLIRLITLEGLVRNARIFAKHVRSCRNGIADSLSRLEFKRFHCLTAKMNMDKLPMRVPPEIWPFQKIWLKS